MPDAKPAQPSIRPQNGLVGVPEGLSGDSGLLSGLALARSVQTAAGALGKVEMRAQHPQGGASSFPTPWGDLDPVAEGCEDFVGVLAGFNPRRGADSCAGAVPDPVKVCQGACLPRAQSDGPRVAAALVIRVQEQTSQLVHRAPAACEVAGDGGGDAVAVLGQALPVLARDDPSLTVEPAVVPHGVAAGEIAEEDEISGDPRQSGEPQR